MAKHFPNITTEQEGNQLQVRAGCGRVEFDLDSGRISLEGLGSVAVSAAATVDGTVLSTTSSATEIQINDPVLVRVRTAGRLGGDGQDKLEFSLTYDLFQTGNLHIYARLRALEAITLDRYELPVLTLPPALSGTVAHEKILPDVAELAEIKLISGEMWLDLRGSGGSLGFIVQKLPWHAHWNDAGCYGPSTLQQTGLHVQDGEDPKVGLVGEAGWDLAAGDTLEASVLLRPGTTGWAETRREAVLNDRVESLFCSEEEFNSYLTWEIEDGWLGPHITDGSPHYPTDQLIRRVMGLNVLAKKRFTWGHEDFSLWHVTKKDRFWEIAVKKVYGVMQDQSEHGGWYEGIQFYHLPPKHYQGYPTYIAAHALFDAYDNTGFDKFLEAAARIKNFWGGEPPANSYSRDGEDRVWHRWGGYILPNGDTDERHVLNTHAMGVLFHAMYYERTGDEEALSMVQQGMNAVVVHLPILQQESGRLWYCLSQVDPTLERAGDPPYLRLNLVPGIEDVYTVASSYRLMLANRVAKNPAITEMIRRALTYFWRTYQKGESYTYRVYPIITYAVAAGEIDLQFALALPLMMKNRDNWTAIHRGFSAFIKPYDSTAYHVEIPALGPSGVESVFIRSNDQEFIFALVNIENPVSDLPVTVQVGDETIKTVVEVDPRDSSESPVDFGQTNGQVTFETDISEFGLRIFSLRR